MKPSIIILIALVLISAFALIILTNQQIFSLLKNGQGRPEEPTAEQQQSKPVLTDGKVVAACQLTPIQSAELSFHSSGLVEEFLVAEGSTVKAGDVLAQLDGIKQAQADLVTATQDENEAQAALTRLKEDVQLTAAQALKELRDATIDEKNARKLVKSLEDADKSEEEIQQAEAGLGLARVQLKLAQENYERKKNGPDPEDLAAAEARLEETQAWVDASKEALASRKLLAPFAGTVTQIYLSQGEFAGPGIAVLQFADLNGLQIQTTNLTELNILDIAPGDSATVTFDALREVSIPGLVRSIQQFGKNVQGDILYTVFIDGEFNRNGLLWGMTCSVVIGE